jgi:serine/threonine protein kinase
MAPEQVRGQAVDHRADIFALGSILYELLSGRRAFAGETSIDTMTAILKEDPPDLRLSSATFRRRSRVSVDRCLEKQPLRGLEPRGDLAFRIGGAELSFRPVRHGTAAPANVRRVRVHPAWIAATLLMVALAGCARPWACRIPSAASEDTTDVPGPHCCRRPTRCMVDTSPARRIALSPDGTRLAFTALPRRTGD